MKSIVSELNNRLGSFLQSGESTPLQVACERAFAILPDTAINGNESVIRISRTGFDLGVQSNSGVYTAKFDCSRAVARDWGVSLRGGRWFFVDKSTRYPVCELQQDGSFFSFFVFRHGDLPTFSRFLEVFAQNIAAVEENDRQFNWHVDDVSSSEESSPRADSDSDDSVPELEPISTSPRNPNPVSRRCRARPHKPRRGQ